MCDGVTQFVARQALIRSYAKINLFLDIVCKRRDGYHNIETIFQTISLHDVIEIELTSSTFELTCSDPAIPTGRENLVHKAFRAASDCLKYAGGARIRIEKSVPPGAGLGGGSSNAAATLVAMTRLLEGGMSESQLQELGRTLGADVPFFITGGAAAGWQVGDKILSLPALPKTWIVLAIPHGVAVSTKEAYADVRAPDCEGRYPETLSECSEKLQGRVQVIESLGRSSATEKLGSILFNSFEESVFSRHPEIAKAKELLMTSGADGALMSGSGSAVFGLARSAAHADELKRTVENAGTCRWFVAHTLPHGME